jgi:hypothetical protein
MSEVMRVRHIQLQDSKERIARELAESERQKKLHEIQILESKEKEQRENEARSQFQQNYARTLTNQIKDVQEQKLRQKRLEELETEREKVSFN